MTLPQQEEVRKCASSLMLELSKRYEEARAGTLAQSVREHPREHPPPSDGACDWLGRTDLPTYPSLKGPSDSSLPVHFSPERLLPWGVQRWMELEGAGSPLPLATASPQELQRLTGGVRVRDVSTGSVSTGNVSTGNVSTLTAVAMGSGVGVGIGALLAFAFSKWGRSSARRTAPTHMSA